MYVGMQVTVCVRPEMYMNTHICICMHSVCVCAFLCQTVKQVWGLFLLRESEAQYC